MKNHLIYENVRLGSGSTLEAYVIIGNPPRGKVPGEVSTKIGANAVIRSHTVIYAGNEIGENFQTGHAAFLRESNKIGNNVSLGSKTIIEHHVTIEDNVRIHSQAFVPEFSILKRGCWIGPNVVLTNAKYPLSPQVKENLAGPCIGENAIIGANVTLLPGVKIGKNALIGAGSVVTKDVPDYCVAVGNPARVIKKIENLPYGDK